jgi:D-alanyl-lipoteichoic acid acyltransferase DltB (MBOAT superfamily)
LQFSSVVYLLFLAMAAIVYFLLPGPRSRTAWLLAASYAFYYSMSAAWTAVLALVTLVGFAFGLLIERAGPATPSSPIPPRTRRWLAAGIVVVVATLCFFKYAGATSWMLRQSLSLVDAGGRFSAIRLVLPVGISFWTFQTIAYLTDIAKGNLPAEKNLSRYALFIAFFPHVAAGPIARGGQLLPQLAEKHAFSYEGMRSGLLLMLWGFFKKLVVADPLGVSANTMFKDPHAYAHEPLVLLAGVLAFAVQLYCDFSGYTDIARGSARLFGVDLLPNFDRPYFSRSVKEFWRRWHMSLMGWLKDYVYIPLGGSRVPVWRRRLNVLAVFAISGIWHGAGLTFLFWGLLNGAYQLAGEILAPARAALRRVLRLNPDGGLVAFVQTATTFMLIAVAWVFFRASSIADAFYILGHLLPMNITTHTRGLLALGLPNAQLKTAVAGTAVVFAAEWLQIRMSLTEWLFRLPTPARWFAYQAAILAVVVFGYYGPVYSAAAFAYFKF